MEWKNREHAVLGIFDITPVDVDIDLEELVKKINTLLENDYKSYVETHRIEPIAFGLKKIVARINMPEDIEGGTQPIEDAITDMEDVQRGECGMVSRT